VQRVKNVPRDSHIEDAIVVPTASQLDRKVDPRERRRNVERLKTRMKKQTTMGRGIEKPRGMK
jgi:hypothetical protein